jgi:hypothetical protein
VFIGLGLMIGALIWARNIRRRSDGAPADYRGPWVTGTAGLAVFLLYLWLVSSGLLQQ